MQVFIIGSPYLTASHLDAKRLFKQIIECGQILGALDGKTKAWANHPVTKMYQQHRQWLVSYSLCLQAFHAGCFYRASQYSDEADNIRPPFHTELYFEHMKARLYTKSPAYYATRFGEQPKTEINMYWVPETKAWVYYRNGKRLKLCKHPRSLIRDLISALNGGEYEDGHNLAQQLKDTGDPYLIADVNKLLSCL